MKQSKKLTFWEWVFTVFIVTLSCFGAYHVGTKSATWFAYIGWTKVSDGSTGECYVNGDHIYDVTYVKYTHDWFEQRLELKTYDGDHYVIVKHTVIEYTCYGA